MWGLRFFDTAPPKEDESEFGKQLLRWSSVALLLASFSTIILATPWIQLIFLVLFLIAFIVAVITATLDEEPLAKRTILKYIFVIVLLIVAVILACSVIRVPGGYQGVVTNGFAIGTQFDEGYHLKNPLSVVEMQPYKIQVFSFVSKDESNEDEGSVKLRSKDAMPIYMDSKLTYRVHKEDVAWMRINNPDYRQQIDQVVRQAPRDYASLFMAKDIIGAERLAFVKTVINTTIQKLQSNPNLRIEIIDYSVQDLRSQADYERSIRNVKIAEQQALQAQFEYQKKIVEALAEKNATIIEAQGEAEAIRLIQDELARGSDYIKLKNIEYTWQTLSSPDSNVKFVVLPQEMLPILNLSDLVGG